jgi:hypothetical protein
MLEDHVLCVPRNLITGKALQFQVSVCEPVAVESCVINHVVFSNHGDML